MYAAELRFVQRKNTRTPVICPNFTKDCFFPVGPIVVMSRPQSSLCLTWLSPDQWTMAGERNTTFLARSTCCSGVCERTRKYPQIHGKDLVKTRSSRASVNSSRDYTQTPEGERDPSDDQDDKGPTVSDRLLFFNISKPLADYFRGTRPSEDCSDRARSSIEGYC